MINNAMRPVHPGEVLREEFLVPLEMSANALAMRLHVSAPRINDVVRGKCGVSVDTALRLVRFFNNTPEFWLNIQIAYDLKVTKARKAVEIEHDITPMVA